MQNKNQSEPTSKIPQHKTSEVNLKRRAYYQSAEYKANQKAYRQTPEFKSKRKARKLTLNEKAYQKAYRQTPEAKAKKKAYEQTPEAKDKKKAREQSTEYKAKKKAYQQTPEYKAKKKAYQQTPEYKAKQKAWREANHEKVLASNKASHEKRLKKDPLYASKCILRSAVLHTFKRIGKNKPANTQNLLGCDSETAKAHIESLFKEGMTWNNHGVFGWHIDHIRPVSSFTEEDMHLMNHISNLQPLWAGENWEKSDKIL